MADAYFIKRMADAYFMDLENYVLEDGYWCLEDLQDKKRLSNVKWMEMIETNIDYRHPLPGSDFSDFDYKMNEYKEWVGNGGGDEWFHSEKKLNIFFIIHHLLAWAKRAKNQVEKDWAPNGPAFKKAKIEFEKEFLF